VPCGTGRWSGTVALPETAYARSLLGCQVRVKLGEQTVVHGRLLAFSDDGEFEVADSMGAVHYCWPMLAIEPLGAGDA
jgi:hypothetical protein